MARVIQHHFHAYQNIQPEKDGAWVWFEKDVDAVHVVRKLQDKRVDSSFGLDWRTIEIEFQHVSFYPTIFLLLSALFLTP
jgi:hypothetical protein